MTHVPIMLTMGNPVSPTYSPIVRSFLRVRVAFPSTRNCRGQSCKWNPVCKSPSATTWPWRTETLHVTVKKHTQFSFFKNESQIFRGESIVYEVGTYDKYTYWLISIHFIYKYTFFITYITCMNVCRIIDIYIYTYI